MWGPKAAPYTSFLVTDAHCTSPSHSFTSTSTPRSIGAFARLEWLRAEANLSISSSTRLRPLTALYRLSRWLPSRSVCSPRASPFGARSFFLSFPGAPAAKPATTFGGELNPPLIFSKRANSLHYRLRHTCLHSRRRSFPLRRTSDFHPRCRTIPLRQLRARHWIPLWRSFYCCTHWRPLWRRSYFDSRAFWRTLRLGSACYLHSFALRSTSS